VAAVKRSHAVAKRSTKNRPADVRAAVTAVVAADITTDAVAVDATADATLVATAVAAATPVAAAVATRRTRVTPLLRRQKRSTKRKRKAPSEIVGAK
jgi:hypothetical protein